jgi:hypothetical protein
MTAVADVEPLGHACPAVQAPEHEDEFMPSTLPYRPPRHIGQLLDPTSEYCPAGHSPLQALDVSATTPPYRPGAHCWQVLELYATLYCPAGHG